MLRHYIRVIWFPLLLPTLALAQESPDEIARHDLLAGAVQASERGDHAGALEQVERAGRLRMTASVRLWLAREHRALAHPLEALDNATACQREAQAQPTLNNRQRILDECTALVTELRGQVGRLVVRVPSPAPSGLQMRVGNNALNAALWGVAYPVRPGATHVEGALGGRVVFARDVTVNAGQEVAVEVTIAAEPTPSVATNHNARTAPTTPTVAPTSGPGAGPWVVAGGGVALVVLGGVFWALREGAVGNCTVEADAIACPTAADATRAEDAAGMGVAANVSLGIGIAAVAGGALWFVLGRPRERSTASVSVLPVASGGVLNIAGRF